VKIVLQRVRFAKVEILTSIKNNPPDPLHREIGVGLLALIAFKASDTVTELSWMVKKIAGLRIFSDSQGQMNHSVKDIGGEILIVSQFTLYADALKGNRPSFSESAPPEKAHPLYHRFLEIAQTEWPGKVKCGTFGANMAVTLLNDGPVTIVLEREASNPGPENSDQVLS